MSEKISDATKTKLLHFNDFLNDVYGTEFRISDALNKMGFPTEKAAELKDLKLDDFFIHLEFALKCKLYGDTNSRRAYQIVCRRYGLFGLEKETLQSIGERFGISRERIRQLEQKAIRRMKSKYDPMSILITLAACNAVGIDAMDVLNPTGEWDDED